MSILLASASPRRKELLARTGLSFTVRPADGEPELSGLSPEETVKATALYKAEQVAAGAAPEDVILAADTLVYLDGCPLGKPVSREDAADMLFRLSGREHMVYTGLAVIRGDMVRTACEGTAVRFRPLSEETVWRYVDSGEPMDKAGAYGIQGLGALLVEGINGDYFNVVGLPLCRLGLLLREFGIELP